MVSHVISWYHMVSHGITWYHMVSQKITWYHMMLVDNMLLCAGWPTAMAESSDRWGYQRPVKAWQNEPAVSTDSLHFWSYWDTSRDGLGVCWGAREWGVSTCMLTCMCVCVYVCVCVCVYIRVDKAADPSPDYPRATNEAWYWLKCVLHIAGNTKNWACACTFVAFIHPTWDVIFTLFFFFANIGNLFTDLIGCFLIVAVWYQEHQEISCPQWQSCLHSGQTRRIVPFPGFLSSRENLRTRLDHLFRILRWIHHVTLSKHLWSI